MLPVRPTSNLLVLIVDDEATIHDSLGRLLRSRGFATAHATNIAEATAVAEAQDVSAVLLDISLNGSESGLPLLRWMRLQSRYEHTPVLVLTGELELDEGQQKAIHEHRAYVLHKPQAISELTDHLRRVLG